MAPSSCFRGLSMLAAAWLCAYARAGDAPTEWVAIDSDRLEEMRGGLETSDGLRVAFAIERTTYINGELVASSNVFIPDAGHITAEQAEAFQAANKVLLVQNGANNQFDATGLGAGSTVIQNTLSDQQIATTTTITADVNTLSMFQGLNLRESLQQALENVAGPR